MALKRIPLLHLPPLHPLLLFLLLAHAIGTATATAPDQSLVDDLADDSVDDSLSYLLDRVRAPRRHQTVRGGPEERVAEAARVQVLTQWRRVEEG